MNTNDRRILAAALGLSLVLLVLFASAAIRLGAEAFEARTLFALRAGHRVSASLEVLAMLALGWIAWRSRARDRALAVGAGIAAALTVFLSVLGILAGKNPAPAAALGNLLGGLALAAAFAWIAGRSRGQGSTVRKALPATAAVLVAVQCVLGAWIAIFAEELWTAPLFFHALLGLAIAGVAAWLALRRDRAASRFALLGLALATPAAGFVSALFGQPLAAQLAHAVAAALVVAAGAYACGRALPLRGNEQTPQSARRDPEG